MYVKIGQDRSTKVKIGQDRSRQVKIGLDGSRWVKIGQDRSISCLKIEFENIGQNEKHFGTSVRRSSGRRSGVAVRAVDCWQ